MANIGDASASRSRMGAGLSKILEDLQRQREKSERKPISKPVVVREIVVAVMGATGAGKSTFIKRVTEDEAVVVGSGLQSMTQDVYPFKFEYGGKHYSLVDTPGFNDTNRSDREILESLVHWLQNGTRLSGIVYLHRISAPRMEGSSMRNLRMFRKLCGEGFMRNVVLGTTFWDTVDEETGVAREEELLETEDFFKQMKTEGCDIVRISDNREACLDLLSRFAAKQPTVMRIQQELFEGKSLDETGAASAINPELAELQRQNNEKYTDAKHRMQRDLTRSELEKAYSLKLERREHDAQMETVESQQEELRDEMKQQELEAEEKLGKLRSVISSQNQGYQMKLDQLLGQMQAMKS